MNPNPAYYVLVSGKEYGPYGPSDLQAALAENTIEQDCLVRAGLSGEWKPVSDVVTGVSKRVPLKGLAALRHNTFYRPLRILVSAAALVFVVSAIMTLGVSAWDAISRQDKSAVSLCVQFLGAILGTLVIRGLAIALIDLADVQLSSFSRKHFTQIRKD